MYKFLKVVFDVLLALIALVCVSWLLLPCMLILWCTGEHKYGICKKGLGTGTGCFLFLSSPPC